ncbi:MAG: TerB family tellurite resistance protein [Nannocystaceae bacterium]|nr:TerB family tellurite resistance protein [Nannocystaceae bacterium]
MAVMDTLRLPSLAHERLADAVQAVMTSDPRRAQWLAEGAAASAAHGAEDLAARRFQTVLELGYLVASADGFAASEREQLARLLASMTGAALPPAVLEQHFRDLDQAVALLGRRERLARVAADIEGPEAAADAITVAALIAFADGELAAPELSALYELGAFVGLSDERVRALANGLADRLRRHMEATP